MILPGLSKWSGITLIMLKLGAEEKDYYEHSDEES